MTAEAPPEDQEELSPELVLVSSPEVARRARERLPEPHGDGVLERRTPRYEQPVAIGPVTDEQPVAVAPVPDEETVAVAPVPADDRPPPPPYPRFDHEDVRIDPVRRWTRGRIGLTVGFLAALVVGAGYGTATWWDSGQTTNDAAAPSTAASVASNSQRTSHLVPTGSRQGPTSSTGGAGVLGARTVTFKTTSRPAPTRARASTGFADAPKTPTVTSKSIPQPHPTRTEPAIHSTTQRPSTTTVQARTVTAQARTVTSGPTAPPRSTPAQPVSDDRYRLLLLQAIARANAAGLAVQRAVAAGSGPVHMRVVLLGWADVEARLGTAFQTLKPPPRAVSVNGVLARGELVFAAELRSIAANLPHDHTALSRFVQGALGNATGPRTIDGALAKLRAAGYSPHP